MTGQQHGAHQKPLGRKFFADVMERPGRIPQAMDQQNATFELTLRPPFLGRVPLQFRWVISGLKVALLLHPFQGLLAISGKAVRRFIVAGHRATGLKGKGRKQEGKSMPGQDKGFSTEEGASIERRKP
jgi:hypothetical protein